MKILSNPIENNSCSQKEKNHFNLSPSLPYLLLPSLSDFLTLPLSPHPFSRTLLFSFSPSFSPFSLFLSSTLLYLFLSLSTLSVSLLSLSISLSHYPAFSPFFSNCFFVTFVSPFSSFTHLSLLSSPFLPFFSVFPVSSSFSPFLLFPSFPILPPLSHSFSFFSSSLPSLPFSTFSPLSLPFSPFLKCKQSVRFTPTVDENRKLSKFPTLKNFIKIVLFAQWLIKSSQVKKSLSRKVFPLKIGATAFRQRVTSSTAVFSTL